MPPEIGPRILLRMRTKIKTENFGGMLLMENKGNLLIKYNSQYEAAWDRFILSESINGTFLQTRNFLNYHPAQRFQDNSLVYLKGTNIIAVIPANEIIEDGKKKLISHMGSTFGGIVLGKMYKKIKDVQVLFKDLDDYLKQNGYSEIILKQTSTLFSSEESDLLEYFLFLNNYISSCEIGYYINFDNYDDDIIKNFTSSRRRGYKYSLKNPFEFKRIESDEDVKQFYLVLEDNMKKFNTVPLHSLEEMLEFKNYRLKSIVQFYGVYLEQELAAGAMIFCFGKQVFHTQYLAAKQEKLGLYPNEFLYKNLIEIAKQEGFKSLSFGTSTLEHGRVLNQSLAQFKEGFGTMEYVNRTFTKAIQGGLDC